MRCCQQVYDAIERAACTAIGATAGASTCANAMIAYQVFGGCAHQSSFLPDIFNSDGSYNDSRDCYYLEQACRQTGNCNGYYDQCSNGSPISTDDGWGFGGSGSGSGSGSGGWGSGNTCDGFADTTRSDGRNDYVCCMVQDPIACDGYGYGY